MLLAALVLSACGQDRPQDKPCVVVDPVVVDLGGVRYAIPAAYQPGFSHANREAEKAFHLFEQRHLNEHKEALTRYCRREGAPSVDGILFKRPSIVRRGQRYDPLDAVMQSDPEKFRDLQFVSRIALDIIRQRISSAIHSPIGESTGVSDDDAFFLYGARGNQRALYSSRELAFQSKVSGRCFLSHNSEKTEACRLSSYSSDLAKPY